METLDLSMVRRLVRESELVYVSTVSEGGYPVTRVMFNLHNPERFPKQAPFLEGADGEFSLYLGTNAESCKVAHIRQEPRMSLYYHTHDSWQGLLIGGRAEVVTDPGIRRGLWQDDWSVYYEGGLDGQDYTIVRLRPDFAEYYYNLAKQTLVFGKP